MFVYFTICVFGKISWLESFQVVRVDCWVNRRSNERQMIKQGSCPPWLMKQWKFTWNLYVEFWPHFAWLWWMASRLIYTLMYLCLCQILFPPPSFLGSNYSVYQIYRLAAVLTVTAFSIWKQSRLPVSLNDISGNQITWVQNTMCSWEFYIQVHFESQGQSEWQSFGEKIHFMPKLSNSEQKVWTQWGDSCTSSKQSIVKHQDLSAR